MFVWVYACMPKRTTVVFDDEVYEMLVLESIRRYGSTKGISKVLNELLKEKLGARNELLELLYSEKEFHVDEEEFNVFRKKLSRGAETR